PGTHTPPATLLAYLNTQLARSYTRDGTFVTAFYAVLDPSTRTLTYSAAGHNPPRLVRARGDTGVLSLDKASSLPLGVLVEQAYTEATLTMDCGDVLLLYTDGITEAMAPRNDGRPFELFGIGRLDEVLTGGRGSSAPEYIDLIRSAVGAFTENRP